MKLILAADHRGFKLKEFIKPQYPNVVDVGALEYNPDDDYVDFAKAAAMQLKDDDMAVLFCGSGHGMDMVANRFPQARAILGFNVTVVEQGRGHENANVLIIPADWVTSDEAKQLIDTFLQTPYSNEPRHNRRLEKLSQL